MPSRRAVLAAAAGIPLAGCASTLNPPPSVAAAATGKWIDAQIDGDWEPVARCVAAAGHEFGHEDAPVDVPLVVRPGEALDRGTAAVDLPERGPLLARGALLEDLRAAYELVRYGLVLTNVDRDPVNDRDPGDSAVYWAGRGEFNRVAVGDRVEYRPAESDPHGVRAIPEVASVRTD